MKLPKKECDEFVQSVVDIANDLSIGSDIQLRYRLNVLLREYGLPNLYTGLQVEV